MSTGKIVTIIVLVIVLIIVVPVVLAGVLVVYLQTLPQGSDGLETQLGIRVEGTTGGNWIVTITTGSKTATTVHLQVVNSYNGHKTIDKTVTGLGSADPDATYNNNNANIRLDAGDTILIKGSGGNAISGYRVQLTVGESIVAGPRTLP